MSEYQTPTTTPYGYATPPPAPYGHAVSGPPPQALANQGARLVARIIDIIVIIVALGVVLGFFALLQQLWQNTGYLIVTAILGLICSVAVLLYEPILTWKYGATLGKRALGLAVAEAQGRRLKGGHALLRFLAAAVSWLTLNIGHALAALPPYLALHDRISETRVLRRAASKRLPAWAKAWLLAQLLATVAACAGLFLWLQAAMLATMQQTLGLY